MPWAIPVGGIDVTANTSGFSNFGLRSNQGVGGEDGLGRGYH